MFIAQNPIERSVFVVVTFWYTTLFALSGFHGVPVWHVIYLFPVSLLITGVGGAVSIAWVIATYRKSRGITGQELKAGSRVRQASFSLGALPRIQPPEHVRRDDMALLGRLPWWNPIRQRAPRYADAIRAVLRIMNTCPRFPASPVPGGHGGRTLIEHSVAVASQMLREAGTWSYKGQLDKQGNLRVPLQSGHVHRFQPEDGPLLVLTGLAHDIGKLACWEVIPDEAEQQRRQAGDQTWSLRRVWARLRGTPSGTDRKEPPLRVNEVHRMHDIEGARMLRRVPEIMALPLADRTALLTAIHYYHHPMAMPIAPWVTDKVRSLTELLIKADIETGKQEGHVLSANDPDAEYGREDAPASGDSAPTAAVSEAGTATEASLEAVLAVGREQQRQEMQQGDYEFRLLSIALNAPDAVNGKYSNQRIAWKRGEWIYVMEPLARQNIRNMKEIKDPIWAVDAFEENNGNAAPFTKAVLQQLDARGALLTELDGKRYPATRALFRMRLKEKGTGVIAVFVIKASLFPELYAPEAPKDNVMKLIGPLWGEHTARRGAENTGASTRETTGQAGEQQNAEPLPSAETGQVIHEPAPSDAAAFEEASGMDDADLPFDAGPLNDAPDAVEGEPSDAQQEAPSEREQQTLDDAGTVVDTAAALVNTVLESDWPLIRRERNGTSWVLVDVNSEGGAWIQQEIKMMKASAPTLRFTKVRQVELSDLNIRAWAFEVPKARDAQS